MSDYKQAEHYAGMSIERWESLMKKVDANTASDADLTPGERGAGWHFCSLGWDGLLISPIDLEYKHCGCPDKQHHKREASYYERLLKVKQWIKAEPRDYPQDFQEKFGNKD
jgi:hypothetical protein